MSTRVVYTSRTGNTELLAQRIFEAIPDTDKNICTTEEWLHDTSADTYFVGFWNNRGTCSLEICDLLGELDGRRVALFGTCGMPDEHDYYRNVENAVKVWLPDHVDYLGCYLCQGKMPMSTRRKFEDMRNGENSKEIDTCLRNFDAALLHPDERDLQGAEDFVKQVLGK